jgi:hypothetical protein
MKVTDTPGGGAVHTRAIAPSPAGLEEEFVTWFNDDARVLKGLVGTDHDGVRLTAGEGRAVVIAYALHFKAAASQEQEQGAEHDAVIWPHGNASFGQIVPVRFRHTVIASNCGPVYYRNTQGTNKKLPHRSSAVDREHGDFGNS